MMEYHEHGRNKTKSIAKINPNMTDYGKQSSIV